MFFQSLPAAQAAFPGGVESNSPLDLSGIQLPSAMGKIQEIFQPSASSPVVFLIQDAHCNFTAQTNIQRIMETFSRDLNVHHAGMEGAEGDVDTELFKSHPVMKIKLAVFGKLLKQGELNGPEMAGLTAKRDIKLYGLENKAVYENNRAAFLRALENRPRAAEQLRILREDIEALKGKYFSPELLAFDRMLRDSESKEKDFLAYWKRLRRFQKENKITVKGKFPNLARLEQIKNFRVSLDETQLKWQEDLIFKRLKKEAADKKLERLALILAAYQEDRISRLHYHEKLFAEAARLGMELPLSRKILAYLKQHEVLENMQAQELSREIEIYEKRITGALIRDEEQKKILEYAQKIRLLESLSVLKLTREQWDELSGFFAGAGSEMTAFLRQHGIHSLFQSETLERALEPALEFYRLALRRDQVMGEALSRWLEEENIPRAFLVAGGFHMQGIKKHLREQDTGYVLIAPRGDGRSREDIYLRLMRGEGRLHAGIFLGEGKQDALSIYSGVQAAPRALTRELVEQGQVLAWLAGLKQAKREDGIRMVIDVLTQEMLEKASGDQVVSQDAEDGRRAVIARTVNDTVNRLLGGAESGSRAAALGALPQNVREWAEKYDADGTGILSNDTALDEFILETKALLENQIFAAREEIEKTAAFIKQKIKAVILHTPLDRPEYLKVYSRLLKLFLPSTLRESFNAYEQLLGDGGASPGFMGSPRFYIDNFSLVDVEVFEFVLAQLVSYQPSAGDDFNEATHTMRVFLWDMIEAQVMPGLEKIKSVYIPKLLQILAKARNTERQSLAAMLRWMVQIMIGQNPLADPASEILDTEAIWGGAVTLIGDPFKDRGYLEAFWEILDEEGPAEVFTLLGQLTRPYLALEKPVREDPNISEGPDAAWREKVDEQAVTGSALGAKTLAGSRNAFYARDEMRDIFGSFDQDEVHIVTTGGGGDVLGGFLLASEIKRVYAANGKTPKIILLTSNLKRGAENPVGGPLPFSQMEGLESLGDLQYFARVLPGLKAKVPLSYLDQAVMLDGNQAVSTVELSEGGIAEFTGQSGIDLIMADAGVSGNDLAEDYQRWIGNKKVLLIGNDMGGDILARFPEKIDVSNRDGHPEKLIQSPLTDMLFLDFLTAMRQGEQVQVLLGISAAGGDGELSGNVMREFLRELYQQDAVLGLLDHVKYLNAEPGLLPDTLALPVQSETSSLFLRSIEEFSGANEQLFDPANPWDFSYADYTDMKALTETSIRGGTRTAQRPALFLSTFFVRPEKVRAAIQDSVIKADSAGWNWAQRDAYLKNQLGYTTETTAPINARDRFEAVVSFLERELRDKPEAALRDFLREEELPEITRLAALAVLAKQLPAEMVFNSLWQEFENRILRSQNPFIVGRTWEIMRQLRDKGDDNGRLNILLEQYQAGHTWQADAKLDGIDETYVALRLPGIAASLGVAPETMLHRSIADLLDMADKRTYDPWFTPVMIAAVKLDQESGHEKVTDLTRDQLVQLAQLIIEAFREMDPSEYGASHVAHQVLNYRIIPALFNSLAGETGENLYNRVYAVLEERKQSSLANNFVKSFLGGTLVELTLRLNREPYLERTEKLLIELFYSLEPPRIGSHRHNVAGQLTTFLIARYAPELINGIVGFTHTNEVKHTLAWAIDPEGDPIWFPRAEMEKLPSYLAENRDDPESLNAYLSSMVQEMEEARAAKVAASAQSDAGEDAGESPAPDDDAAWLVQRQSAGGAALGADMGTILFPQEAALLKSLQEIADRHQVKLDFDYPLKSPAVDDFTNDFSKPMFRIEENMSDEAVFALIQDAMIFFTAFKADNSLGDYARIRFLAFLDRIDNDRTGFRKSFMPDHKWKIQQFIRTLFNFMKGSAARGDLGVKYTADVTRFPSSWGNSAYLEDRKPQIVLSKEVLEALLENAEQLSDQYLRIAVQGKTAEKHLEVFAFAIVGTLTLLRRHLVQWPAAELPLLFERIRNLFQVYSVLPNDQNETRMLYDILQLWEQIFYRLDDPLVYEDVSDELLSRLALFPKGKISSEGRPYAIIRILTFLYARQQALEIPAAEARMTEAWHAVTAANVPDKEIKEPFTALGRSFFQVVLHLGERFDAAVMEGFGRVIAEHDSQDGDAELAKDIFLYRDSLIASATDVADIAFQDETPGAENAAWLQDASASLNTAAALGREAETFILRELSAALGQGKEDALPRLVQELRKPGNFLTRDQNVADNYAAFIGRRLVQENRFADPLLAIQEDSQQPHALIFDADAAEVLTRAEIEWILSNPEAYITVIMTRNLPAARQLLLEKIMGRQQIASHLRARLRIVYARDISSSVHQQVVDLIRDQKIQASRITVISRRVTFSRLADWNHILYAGYYPGLALFAAALNLQNGELKDGLQSVFERAAGRQFTYAAAELTASLQAEKNQRETLSQAA